MNSSFDSPTLRRGLPIALLILSVSITPAFGWQNGAGTATATTTAAPKPAAPLSAAETEAAARVKVETIREITAALSANDMAGRGTATPGGERAAKYIADRFSKLGLKPLGDAGTYLQGVKFRSTQVLPESSVKAGDASLKFGTDFVAAPFSVEQADAAGDLVFVGYGVASEELKRDDFAGLDLKGKIVLMAGGVPKNVDEAAWKKATSLQNRIIGLVQRGAAGIIATNVGTKEQPFATLATYLSRRSVGLAGAPASAPPFKLPPIILASNEASEKLFAGAGMTFAEALAKAEAGEFVSRSLGKPATIAVRVNKEEAIGSNVAGILEGADAKLKDQAIIYTAHYDAYGTDAAGQIFPGAADNALGVAEIISIAEAFTKSPQRPRRSVIFLAVTGEEHGLLGAKYWVNNPTWPIDKLVANFNFDGIGTEVYGPLKKIVGFGAEHSDLGAVLDSVAAATGNVLTPDPMPEEKVFYRSDHYEFVKKGVPALMLMGGPDLEEKAYITRIRKWLETDYHQPTDTIRPDWNWQGPRSIAVVGLVAGMRVANNETAPAWLPSSPFNKARGAAATPSAN